MRVARCLTLQPMDAEELLLAAPGPPRREARLLRQRAEILHRVFVRILGVDRLALRERDLWPATRTLCAARLTRYISMRCAVRIVEGVMGEGVQVEIRAQLAIGARQQVLVERRGDAGRVVIGGMQDRRDPSPDRRRSEGRRRPASPRAVRRKAQRVGAREIADGRAREEAGAARRRRAAAASASGG